MPTTTHSLSEQMRGSLGMVIPVWFPADTPESTVRELLSLALSDVELFVRMEDVLLQVDGSMHVVPAIEEVRRATESRLGATFELSVKEANLGKGGAVALGFETLLERTELEYLCIRDDDGDHSIYDLPHLYRLAIHIAEDEETDLVAVCGRRFGLHRPLGFLRAEYEMILAELIWEALKFALAREGRALNTRHLNSYGCVPDIQSGYKVYSRPAAALAVEGLQQADREHPDLRMMGWGVEIVPAVEIVMADGVFGEMLRTTYETQPMTTFDHSERHQEYAREALWVLKRLDMPPPAAIELLDNIIPTSTLYQEGAGRKELLAMREFVVQGLGCEGTAPKSIDVPRFF